MFLAVPVGLAVVAIVLYFVGLFTDNNAVLFLALFLSAGAGIALMVYNAVRRRIEAEMAAQAGAFGASPVAPRVGAMIMTPTPAPAAPVQPFLPPGLPAALPPGAQIVMLPPSSVPPGFTPQVAAFPVAAPAAIGVAPPGAWVVYQPAPEHGPGNGAAGAAPIAVPTHSEFAPAPAPVGAIAGYESMRAADIVARVKTGELARDDLLRLRATEVEHAGRKTVLDVIDRELARKHPS